mmetsp:Transcript_78457/g.123704  ORF Transcript_78457/g.123704 Transcript_78457/m.123704 type:complete len:86 (-) Transcript_78457:369-626(-)
MVKDTSGFAALAMPLALWGLIQYYHTEVGRLTRDSRRNVLIQAKAAVVTSGNPNEQTQQMYTLKAALHAETQPVGDQEGRLLSSL